MRTITTIFAFVTTLLVSQLKFALPLTGGSMPQHTTTSVSLQGHERQLKSRSTKNIVRLEQEDKESQEEGEATDIKYLAEDGFITFSVLLKPSAQIEAADLFIPKANYMLQTVLNTTTKVLCQKTDYLMVVNSNDACGRTSASKYATRLNALNKDMEVYVKDVKEELSMKSDEWSIGEALVNEQKYIQWMEFSFRYEIMKVGEDDVSEDAINEVLTKTIAQSVTNKEMTQLLRWWNAKVLMAAHVGNEMDEFTPWAQVFDSWDSTKIIVEPNMENAMYKQLSPTPFHPLRIAGIILFFVTVSSVALLLYLAKKRRLQREEEARHATLNRSAPQNNLRTNEGLDDMLDRGKQESLRRRLGETT